MNTTTKSFLDKWGQWLAHGLVVLMIFAGTSYVQLKMSSELKSYLTLDRYDREVKQRLDLAEKYLVTTKDGFVNAMVDGKLTTAKIAESASDIKVLTSQVVEINRKLDELRVYLLANKP